MVEEELFDVTARQLGRVDAGWARAVGCLVRARYRLLGHVVGLAINVRMLSLLLVVQ